MMLMKSLTFPKDKASKWFSVFKVEQTEISYLGTCNQLVVLVQLCLLPTSFTVEDSFM